MVKNNRKRKEQEGSISVLAGSRICDPRASTLFSRLPAPPVPTKQRDHICPRNIVLKAYHFGYLLKQKHISRHFFFFFTWIKILCFFGNDISRIFIYCAEFFFFFFFWDVIYCAEFFFFFVRGIYCAEFKD